MQPTQPQSSRPSTAPLPAAVALAEDEQQQLLAALRQPLFLQAPLQGLLEHLVQRLAASAAASVDLQRRVAALERTKVSADDLVERVHLCEQRLEAPIAAATPFAVAQLAARVDDLEAAAARLEEDSKQLKFTTSDVLERRLAATESRLSGVTNLSGRLMALDAVAQELGVAIPDSEYTTPASAGLLWATASASQSGSGVMHEPRASTAPAMGATAATATVAPLGALYGPADPAAVPPGSGLAAWMAAADSSASRRWDEAGGAGCTAPGSAGTVGGQLMQSSSAAAPSLTDATAATDGEIASISSAGATRPATSVGVGASSAGAPATAAATTAGFAALTTGGGAIPSKTKQELLELRAQLEVAQAEARATQGVADQLQQQVVDLRQALAEAEERHTTMAANLQDASQSLADAVAAQLASLRRELLKPPEVSLAEFSRVQNIAAASAEESHAAARCAQAVKESEAAVERSLAELQQRVGRALGVRDCDKALSDAVEGVRAELRELEGRLDSTQAGMLAGEGVATKAQLQELLTLMRGKASKEDMRAVLARSVELALDAYRRAAGDIAGTGATRFRCLVCDRELHEPNQRLAGDAVAAPAGWPPTSGPLPRLGALSPPPTAQPVSSAPATRRRASRARSSSPPSERGVGTVILELPAIHAIGGGPMAAGSGGGEIVVALAEAGAAGSARVSPAKQQHSVRPLSGLPVRAATASSGLRGAWTAGNERLACSRQPQGARGPPVFL